MCDQTRKRKICSSSGVIGPFLIWCLGLVRLAVSACAYRVLCLPKLVVLFWFFLLTRVGGVVLHVTQRSPTWGGERGFAAKPQCKCRRCVRLANSRGNVGRRVSWRTRCFLIFLSVR